MTTENQNADNTPRQTAAEAELAKFIPNLGDNAAADEKAPAEEAAKEPAGDAAPKAEDAEKVEEKDDSQEDKGAAKKSRSVEERIAAITRARREEERARAAAERERDELLERIAALEAGKTKKDELTPADAGDTSELKAPDPKDFEYGELDSRFLKAREDFLERKLLAKLEAKYEQQRQAEAAALQARELQTKQQQLIERGVSKYDDFEAVVLENEELNSLEATKETAEVILGSEYLEDIVYHLGKNVAEARELSSKSPLEQARYIGRLEAQFAAEKAAKSEKPARQAPATKAPEPPTRVRGSDGRFTPDDATSDFATFEAKYTSKQRG